MIPEKNHKNLYCKFLNLLNEPLEKTRKNSFLEEFKGVLLYLKFQALDAVIPLFFILFFSFILLLLVFPNQPVLVIIFIAFLISYFFLFALSTAQPIRAALSNFFKPWNEFVFQEISFREPIFDDDIKAVKERLIRKFSLDELAVINELANKDFEVYDEK